MILSLFLGDGIFDMGWVLKRLLRKRAVARVFSLCPFISVRKAYMYN